MVSRIRRVRRMSKQASAYIARKVRVLKREGYRKKQAIAIAYAKARKKGFKVPRKRRG